MNTLLLNILLLMSVFFQTQDEAYTKAMTENQEKSGTLKTVSDYQELSNSYERIAIHEKNQWIPWYYAGLYNVMANFQEQDKRKKEILLQNAQKQISEGLNIQPEESELLVAQVLIYYSQMSLDPSKGAELYPKTNEMLDLAKKINPDNPRVYLTRAEALFGMPEAFGGGKAKAKPLLMQAKEKFEKFVPSSRFAPGWGKERCEMLLQECDK